MKIFFMGTAVFAVPALEKLQAEGFDIAAVVTQPDRPRGRGHQLQPSAVKVAALELGLPVVQPEKIREPAQFQALTALACDAGVVVAYGQILPGELLQGPRLGCVNVHGSLLPRWRGAAPVHWAVAEGDRQTGVCVQTMAQKLDSGDVLLSSAVDADDLTTEALLARLAPLGADLVVRALRGLEKGDLKATPQDPAKVTYAPLLRKADGLADFNWPAQKLVRRCRAFSSQPGFRALLKPQGMELRLYGLEEAQGQGEAGSILERQDGSWIVACGQGAVKIKELQAPGKKRMRPDQFERGHALAPDAKLE